VKFPTRLRVALAVILLAIVIIALAVYLATPPTPSPTPEVTPTAPAPTPTRPLSFEEALVAARNPKPSERWSDLEEYRGINDYKQPPYRAADGSTGHYLYHAADGTLYEATYPSGEIGIPIARVVVPKDKEAYYIWEIRADLKQSFVDARTGEVLYVLPIIPPVAPVQIEFDIKSSYGFDQVIGDRHFVLSRGKSATLTIILTSTADRTLHLAPKVGRLPTGVTAQFDSEFLTLEPNKPVTLKLTITVSSTAPISTPMPTPTIPPPTPEPTPPSILTPTPEIPWDFVEVTFALQEEGYRFKTINYGFQLTIV